MAVENTTGTAGLSEELTTYRSLELLKRNLAHVPMFADAVKTTLPLRSGKTVQWRQWTGLALATTALTEGEPPSPLTLGTTEITGTIAEYGAYAKISRLAGEVFIDDAWAQAKELFGEQAGRSLHKLLIDVLAAGTTVQYASTAAARINVTAAMTLSVAEINEAVRTLQGNNAPRFPDGYYHGLIHPSVSFDLERDTEYRELHKYVDPSALKRGVLTEVGGVRFMSSTDAPVFAGGGAAGADVYGTLIYGPRSYGIVDLVSSTVGRIDAKTQKGFRTTMVEPSTPSKSDPLGQYGTVGWIARFVAKILDQARMVRIESGATV